MVVDLNDIVTTGYLCKLFKRGTLTLQNWRNDLGLPYIRIPGDGRDTIRYDLDAVIDWAQKNHKRIYLDGSHHSQRR